MRDHEILARGGCPLNDIERRHHGGRDAFDGSFRVSGNDSVDSFGAPRDADVLFDPLYDLTRGRGGAPQGEAGSGE
jgi:hypothetical protein